MFSRSCFRACAPALMLLGAACQDDTKAAGPTPADPSNAPLKTAAPSEHPGGSATPAAPGAPATPAPATPAPGGSAAPTATAPATPAPATPAPGGSAATPAPGAGAAPAATAPPTPALADLPAPLSDGQIAAVTDGLNAGEIQQGKVARSKSKNKDVLSFASMMIEHHGQAQKQQAALKETPETSPLAQKLQTDAQTTLTELNQAKAGDFDRAYLDAQVEGHEQALETLKQKLLPSAKSPALIAYLKGLQPKIEQHLSRARTLRDALANRSADAKGKGTTQPASMKQGAASAPPGAHTPKPHSAKP